MVEMVLPGTYIEVRPEGLIVPGRVSVGTIGIVGTAQKGPLNTPVAIGSYLEARELFGDYDAWIDGSKGELSLVRAVEIANAHGATSMIALRIASNTAKAATYKLGDCVELVASSPGTWGRDVSVQVVDADEPAFVDDEPHGTADDTLNHVPVLKNGRNSAEITTAADGITRRLTILYDGQPETPTADQVKIDRGTGKLTFGATLDPADKVAVSYAVDPAAPTSPAGPSKVVTVVLRHGRAEERYTVVSGTDLIADLAGSQLVTGNGLAKVAELPAKTAQPAPLGGGTGNTAGDDGANCTDVDFKNGLELLLDEDAHIIIGAGRTDTFADELNGHCQLASTDAVRRDRIAVVGAGPKADLDTLRGHNLNSDRLVFVAPGIRFGDAASGADADLPAAYSAAAVAGLLSSNAPHVSLTNKVLSVGALETRYTPTQLTQLVASRILALEARQGFRVVKAITTSTNTAWHQITTRRIVDYAKFGVRSAASSYIGLLNNDRVRTALRTTIVSFLNEMVADEMLISYELDVTATREDQRKGIVQVTMILRPTFSIDFIKVTMFLE